MTMCDLFTELCGPSGQSVADLVPGEVSANWIDMGDLTNRIYGGGQLVVARFSALGTVVSADPDNTLTFSIVHSPKVIATPTTARTFGFTVNNATETFASSGHGMINGTRVVITATAGIPTGLAIDTNYYIVNATADTFQVAATPGGAVVAFTTDGTPPHTMTFHPEVIVSTGPVGFNRILAPSAAGSAGWVRELAIGPHELSRAYPVGRYVYAMFTGVTDITATLFTCSLTGGFAMDGKPLNKVNYVTQ